MEMSRHHRKPKSINGSNEPPNTIIVPHNQHMAWHVLFGNMTAHQIVNELNSKWIDPLFMIHATPIIPESLY